MERDRFICCLVGRITALEPSISGEDISIKINESLIESKFTPLGTEPNDNELLQELIDETKFSVMNRFNRKQRRLLERHSK